MVIVHYNDGDQVFIYYSQDGNWGAMEVFKQEGDNVHFYEKPGDGQIAYSAPVEICIPIDAVDADLMNEYNALTQRINEVNDAIVAQLEKSSTN